MDSTDTEYIDTECMLLLNVGLHTSDQGALRAVGSSLQHSTSAVVACGVPQELGCIFEIAEADIAMDGDVAPAL